MFKKITCIGVLLVMVLSVTACSCNIDIPTQLDRELLEYKTSERTELEAYAESKGKDNYTAENWAVIEGILALAKSAIDAAADKAAVDAAVKGAQAAMDGIELKLAEYKTVAKTTLELYAKNKGEKNYKGTKNYSDINWAAICAIVADGKTAVDAAAEKGGVDAAVAATKTMIDAVEEIPPLSSLTRIGQFNDEFFAKYTLILVPVWSPIYFHYWAVEVYTVFAEEGKLNFIIEVTEMGTNAAASYHALAVIIPNEVFGGYEIGRSQGFLRYDWWNNPTTKNDREWLKEIDEKSVKHKAGFLFGEKFWSVPGITVITSRVGLEKLQLA